jgi:N-methylhydantoinase B/oxoprolinase/acetone carboxylase alpha subunit
MYEEGLRLPALKLYSAGEPNKVLFEMIKANVRMPDHVIGDIEAQVSANETAGRKLKELLIEFGINDLTSLTSAILSRSEAVMRAAIEEVPDGAWSHEVKMDGVGVPLTIRATVEVKGSNIHIDYTGTSPQVNVPLNCVPNYTYAYTAYPVRAALCPGLPNNDGVLRPITVSAPPGSLLSSVMFPANVGASPVEVLESNLPILYEEKEFIPDSAGQGEYRGGFGARHRFKVVSSKTMWISAVTDRTTTPAEGLLGGKPGTLFRMTVDNREIPTKDFIPLQPGDVVTIEVPGGGGYGNPEKRRRELIEKDIKAGLVKKPHRTF